MLPSQDVLVLFPNRQFSLAIAKELRSSRIPFSAAFDVPGGGLPLVSVLNKWVSKTSDSLALRQLIHAITKNPSMGIPSALVKKQERKTERENKLRLIAGLWLPVLAGQSENLWDAIQEASSRHELLSSVHRALKELLQYSQEAQDLETFLGALAKHVVPWRKPQDFLKELSAWTDVFSYISPLTSKTNVRLMTFQSAKGLEASVVCAIGLEDGVIPRDASEVDIAEQSRLLFVSMTRAKNELHLFHARKRSSSVVQRRIFPKKVGKPDLSRSPFLNAIENIRLEERYHR